MKRFLTAFWAVFCLLSLVSCGALPSAGPALNSSASAPSSDSVSDISLPAPSTPSPTAPPEEEEPADWERAKQMVTAMELEEKVGQLFFVRCPTENAAADVSQYHLGGYLLFGRDVEGKTADDLIQTIASYQTAADIPLLIGVDEEGGTVARVSDNPCLRAEKYLSPQQLYAAGGMEAITEDTRQKDLLLKNLGFNVNFAPVADVSTDPEDFIYDRSFGGDAEATAAYAAEVVSQMRRDGMGSVLKHFPGYGNNGDTHTGISIDSRSLQSFETSDFLPFEAGITAGDGTGAVLVSHNVMEAVDNTLPASLSPEVHALLREKLAFHGAVITDDLSMEAAAAYAPNEAAAVLALEAGNDMVLTTDYRGQIPQVTEAVRSGRLAEAVINTACIRVLLWKMKLGLL